MCAKNIENSISNILTQDAFSLDYSALNFRDITHFGRPRHI